MKNNEYINESKKSMLNSAKRAWRSIKSGLISSANSLKSDIKDSINTQLNIREPLGFTDSPEVDVERERLPVVAKTPNFDYINNRWYDYATRLNEGKLSPKESLQRKLKKQRYKVSYVQDGKKVEVFASSIRGVRRVVYGKKQYRVHNSTGSDVTGYFKKLLGK